MRPSRLALVSAFALTIAAPAVALADMETDPNPAAPPDSCTCTSACGQAAAREDARQAADQDHAQSSYQLGSRESDWYAPSHPYSQSHYQLGAGHED
jgi:hypothetical protein